MSRQFELHRLVRGGDLQRVRDLLRPGAPGEVIDINACDSRSRTPLMHAVESPKAGVELVRVLLEHGASLHQECSEYGFTCAVVPLCLAGGNPAKLALLLENGAEIQYKRTADYDALIDAVYGRDVLRDPHLLDLLKLLIERGVALNGVSTYGESGFRALSCIGRFDAVQLLFDAGADETLLKWTRLIRSVALGSLADVEKAVGNGAFLEDRDHRSRTAWLLAVQTGDIAKARYLMECGADTAACGHCGHPSLFFAIANHHIPMLEWLLKIGTPVDQTDEFGTTVLMAAIEHGNAEALNILLTAGADVNCERYGQTAISFVKNREMALRLLEAGSNPGELSSEGRRSLLGLEPEADEGLLTIPPSAFLRGWSRRFGNRNPDTMVEPFWEGMIRAGISAHQSKRLFEGGDDHSPVWCAHRFGQSITLLPDGRIIQIGGEHEDSYDPDFCIYNDVFVHEPDGTIHIFGYPESEFPPTDFHTATVVGEYIYVVGSLGYPGTRQYGNTPVYRLHTRTFRMEQMKVGGVSPGWIYRHRALYSPPHEILVLGGEIVTSEGGEEAHTRNERTFILDTERLAWRP